MTRGWTNNSSTGRCQATIRTGGAGGAGAGVLVVAIGCAGGAGVGPSATGRLAGPLHAATAKKVTAAATRILTRRRRINDPIRCVIRSDQFRQRLSVL